MTASKLEALFEAQLRSVGVRFEREFVFAAPRKFRADFKVWRPEPDFGPCAYSLLSFAESVAKAGGVLVEIVGIGPQGRHGSWGQIESDSEKACLAAALGYRVLPITGKMVENGTGLALVEAALGLREVPKYERKSPRRKKGALPARVLAAARRAKRG